MKQLLLLVAISIAGITSYSQEPEFHIYSNGLIYSDTTMEHLKFIVDSLQLKFKSCDLFRNYYSIRQGRGHSIRLDSGKIKAALADMRQDIEFEDFLKKYPLAMVDSFVLITEEDDENYGRREMLDYTNQFGEDHSNFSIHIFKTPGWKVDSSRFGILGKKGRWVFSYTSPDEYSKESIKAFYLPQPPASEKISDGCARLVLYADCMIDTATTVYFKEAKEVRGIFWMDPPKGGPAQRQFRLYLDRETKIVFAKYHSKTSGHSLFLSDSLKQVYIKDSLSPRPEFRRLLLRADSEALSQKNITNDEFENYAELYCSKSAALRLKRNRIVIGNCSQDESPRMHAINIALLAAETADWPVFLRAHLDIMNDRFERITDGSYAWGGRKTYLKEIEDLNIDVPDLLLGTSLRIVDASKNHYFGDIGRLGRALAETKDRQLLEGKILEMIRDNGLDDFNRLVQHYLFLNYIYHLPEKESRIAAIQRLEEADKTLPVYLGKRLKIDHKVIEGGAN
jgi:hypothetical protein